MKKLSQLSAPDLDQLVNLHMALSPENVACDGEIPASQARARLTDFTKNLRDFIKKHDIDPMQAMDECAVLDEWQERSSQRLCASVHSL